MPTERQIEANRLNATKSTGPRTDTGKTRSSRNSFKHGACVSDAAIFGDPDSREVIDQLTREYFDHYRPASPMQRDCLSEIVLCKVRLDRVLRIESGALSDARDKAHDDQVFIDKNGKRCHRFDPEHWPPDTEDVRDNIHLAAAWAKSQDMIRHLSLYEARIYTRYRRALDRWETLKNEAPPPGDQPEPEAQADPPPADQPPSQTEVAPASAGYLPPEKPPRDRAASPPASIGVPLWPADTPSTPTRKNEPNSGLTLVIATPEDTQ